MIPLVHLFKMDFAMCNLLVEARASTPRHIDNMQNDVDDACC